MRTDDICTDNLIRRCIAEAFDGQEREFRQAYDQALRVQDKEVREANPHASDDDLRELITDAMNGVMLQWLGEYPCCPREERVLAAMAFPYPGVAELLH